MNTGGASGVKACKVAGGAAWERGNHIGKHSKIIVRKLLFEVHTCMKGKQHIYHVYIMTNHHHTVFYTGMTGKGFVRIHEHIEKKNTGFTKKYNITKLVYLERFTEVTDAIAREKQIKKWSRKKKVWLIEKSNPVWDDLFVKYTSQNKRT